MGCFAAAFTGSGFKPVVVVQFPHIYAASAERPTSISISTQLTMVTHKRLSGFFCMSCALNRYLSCEAHLGPAWSYSESRQGTQTKTNYAWALGGSQWERLKTSLTKKDCGSIFRREDLPGTTQKKLTKGIISFETPTCSQI